MHLKTCNSSNDILSTQLIEWSKVQCLNTVADHKDSWLWHLRFGYLNFRSCNQLITQDMVTGIPSLEMPKKLCEGCLVGKQSRYSFVSTMLIRSSYILEVVHSDVCGPFEEYTIGGNKHFVLFVDEFNRKLWIFVIKRKDGVFEIFRRFKILVENQSEKKIKVLRINSSGKYTSTSKIFDYFV